MSCIYIFFFSFFVKMKKVNEVQLPFIRNLDVSSYCQPVYFSKEKKTTPLSKNKIRAR